MVVFKLEVKCLDVGPAFLLDPLLVVGLLFVWGLVFCYTLNQAATSQTRVKVYLWQERGVCFVFLSVFNFPPFPPSLFLIHWVSGLSQSGPTAQATELCFAEQGAGFSAERLLLHAPQFSGFGAHD